MLRFCLNYACVNCKRERFLGHKIVIWDPSLATWHHPQFKNSGAESEKKGKLGFDPLPLLTRFVFYFYEVLNRTLLRILPIFNKNKTL